MRILYLVIWGICLKPLGKPYYANTADSAGLPTQDVDVFEFRQGDGYMFTVITKFDEASDRTPLDLFLSNEPQDGEILNASFRASDGIVKLSSDDLRYFEPTDVIERTFYNVDGETEASALLDELDEPTYIEEFPNMRRHYGDDTDDYQLF